MNMIIRDLSQRTLVPRTVNRGVEVAAKPLADHYLCELTIAKELLDRVAPERPCMALLARKTFCIGLRPISVLRF